MFATYSSVPARQLSSRDVTVFESLRELRRTQFPWNFASSVDLDNPISPQLSLPILNEPPTFLSFMIECFLQVDHHVRLKEKTPARLSLVYKPFLERLRFGLINPTNDIRIFECFPPSIFAWGMVRVRDAR